MKSKVKVSSHTDDLFIRSYCHLSFILVTVTIVITFSFFVIVKETAAS